MKWQIAVFVFGLFWIAEFLSAYFLYSIIVGVCSWYFTSTHDTRGNFSLLKGFWWGARYNFGSLAFGSLLLAIIWMIRVLFEYFEKKLKSLMGGDNRAARVVVNCIRCCLDCCHRFVKFLNKNAYIQVALTGESFCSSALAAFVLALKHSGSFLITNGVGSLITFLGKMTISVGNCLIAYLMLTKAESISSLIGNPFPPLIVVFALSYVMGSVFMSVYSISSLTLLQCLYADVDICDQLGREKFSSKYRPREMESVVYLIRRH